MSSVFKVGIGGISGSIVDASGRKTGSCLGYLARSDHGVGKFGVVGRYTVGCTWVLLL